MKKKILISTFMIIDQGGISSSILNLLNEIKDMYDVTLCVVTNYISPNVVIPKGIKIANGSTLLGYCQLDRNFYQHQSILKKVVRNFLRLCRRVVGVSNMVNLCLHQINNSNQYDVAIAFSNDIYQNGKKTFGADYDNVLKRINANNKIAWIHNDSEQLGFTHDICLRIFKEFDAIVNVSFDCKRRFDEIVPEYKEKSYVVYNCYNIEEIKSKAGADSPYEDNGKLHFVTVCRMNEQQKRVSRIVEVCNLLKQEGYNNFDWTVVGDGGDRANYEAASQTYGTTDILHFVGLKSNPYPYMKHADAFILSSLYEGFGMTIRESQITGTPTFSTRFGAAEEAILHGKQGLICENSTDGLYIMVRSLLDDPTSIAAFRAHLSEHPINNSIAIQQLDNILNKQL